MKRILLFFTFAITQLLSAQIPNSVYTHDFTETLVANNFTIGSFISLTADRQGYYNRAANLPAGHGPLLVDIQSNKAALMQQGSISFWFKYSGYGTSAFGNDKPLVFWSNGNSQYSEGLSFSLATNGIVKVISYKDSNTGGASLSNVTNGINGEWHHFTVTWKFGSEGFVKGYVDGNMVVNKVISHQLDTAANSIYFTGFNNSFPSSLHGVIDDIKVFTQVLTDTEINFLGASAPMCELVFPDINFKNALLSHTPAIDLNNNGKIECHEASQFTESLNLNNMAIQDLTGLSAFTGVKYVNCSGNQLTYVDFSQNPGLTRIDCNANQITSLDLSANTSLITLNCGENRFVNVDVSANTALNSFHATGSPNLTSLNLANGNNTNFIRMMVAGSPNLTCIKVDNVAQSTSNWVGGTFNKPSGASYSINCALSISDFDIKSVHVYPNPTSGMVTVSEVAHVTVFDSQGRTILKQENITSFDLSNQVPGIYFANILTEKQNETIKIIKK